MAGLFDLQRKMGVRGLPPVGLQGIPQLKADQLISPTIFILKESASEFLPLEISRPCRMFVTGEHRDIRAWPGDLKYDGATHIAKKLYVPSYSGILDLGGAGLWHINTKIVAAEGTRVEAVYTDAAFAVPDAETDDSWISKFDPRSLLAPSSVALTTDGTIEKVAARVGRRYLYLRVHTFAGGCTRVSLGFGNNAADGSGVILEENEWVAFDALDGVTEQYVKALTDVGTATLSIQEGV